jgi:hypothetical protein
MRNNYFNNFVTSPMCRAFSSMIIAVSEIMFPSLKRTIVIDIGTVIVRDCQGEREVICRYTVLYVAVRYHN